LQPYNWDYTISLKTFLGWPKCSPEIYVFSLDMGL
jgi:hypothetical protein